MSQTKFQLCNVTHENQLQYCCLRSNRMFCQKCWFIQQHPYRCKSSSCGHWQKLAHSVIQKALQMKLMHFTSQLSSNANHYQKIVKCFIRYKKTATQQIKNVIQNKLPLFLLSGMIEMLSFINPKFKSMVYEEAACSNMLKIIKRKQENKLKNLQNIIKQLQRVNFLTQGLQNKIGSKKFQGNSDKQLEKVISFYQKQGFKKIIDVSAQVKKNIQNQFGQLLTQFDPSIKYAGVIFNSKQNFQLVQNYNFQSLYSKLACQPTSISNLYHGIPFQIQKLQQTPQLLLQVSKSILKQKIFNMHRNITQLKSSYPYKYGYLISTSVIPDPQYQLTIIGLDKINIKNYQKKSQQPFLNSINIIIMGPQLIIIEFKNIPKRMIDISIYGYQNSRQKHYTQIFQSKIGLKNRQQSPIPIKRNNYQFQTQLSMIQLMYVQFQLAYQHLFTERQNIGQFQGQKYVLNRGINLMNDIVSGWKDKAVIQFNIQNQDKYNQFII